MESRINVVINILDLMKSYRLLSSVALLSLLLLIGCHFPQRDSFVLDIDNALSQNQQSQDLSSIATSIHYIKLKSAADLMIDNPNERFNITTRWICCGNKSVLNIVMLNYKFE